MEHESGGENPMARDDLAWPTSPKRMEPQMRQAPGSRASHKVMVPTWRLLWDVGAQCLGPGPASNRGPDQSLGPWPSTMGLLLVASTIPEVKLRSGRQQANLGSDRWNP
jgi:hypothetical protein